MKSTRTPQIGDHVSILGLYDGDREVRGIVKRIDIEQCPCCGHTKSTVQVMTDGGNMTIDQRRLRIIDPTPPGETP